MRLGYVGIVDWGRGSAPCLLRRVAPGSSECSAVTAAGVEYLVQCVSIFLSPVFVHNAVMPLSLMFDVVLLPVVDFELVIWLECGLAQSTVTLLVSKIENIIYIRSPGDLLSKYFDTVVVGRSVLDGGCCGEMPPS